jgi:hypothetical protein
MKQDSLLGKDNFMRVKEIMGTCNSMGVMVEGKPAFETILDVNAGKFKDKIAKGKTELTAEELMALEAERKKLAAEIEARRVEFETRAKSIIASMAGKTRGEIKTKLVEAEIPVTIINELLPSESAAAGAAGAAGAAAGGAGAGAKGAAPAAGAAAGGAGAKGAAAPAAKGAAKGGKK